jgi:hypothetical protein
VLPDEVPPVVEEGVAGAVVAGAGEAAVAFSVVVACSFFVLAVESDDSPVGGFILSE